MKTLLLLRHAKSSWGEPGLDDHDRTLSPRGVRAAELVAVYLAQRSPQPAFALASTARRALDTLEPIRRRLGLPYADDSAVLATQAALLGLSQALFILSVAPFIMQVSNEATRTAMFSANFGLQTLAGFFGSFLALSALRLLPWPTIHPADSGKQPRER